MKSLNISIILGTRPEIIKMSPIIRELEKRSIDFQIIHTGQHYSYKMDKIFFDELGLPNTNVHLDVGSGSHAEQTGKTMIGVETVLKKYMPDIVLVEGDTNSVLAGSLAAVKLKIPVGHVEAGLRSFDRTMPEEINRMVADHCSELLFAPTNTNKSNLLNEGIPEDKIFVTGNTVVDACLQHLEIAEKANKHITILNKIGFKKDKYAILTLHRAENVDNKKRFKNILSTLEVFNYPVVYPIHPRSLKMAKELDLIEKMGKNKNLVLIEPIGYMDFLALLSSAKFVMTDSGGVQEEALTLKIPCLTLRYNTERPETVEAGGNVLVGTEPDRTLYYVNKLINDKKFLNDMRNTTNPYGDGSAGAKIVDVIVKQYERDELHLASSNFIDNAAEEASPGI